jgi:hypothetical protein
MKMELIKALKSKMPSPKGSDEMLDADSVAFGGEESPEEEAMEMEAMEPAMLADLSDDELLAEVKKRGLSLGGKKPSKGEPEELELEEVEEDEEYS